MKEKIVTIITEYAVKSGNKSGLSVAKLQAIIGVDYNEIKDVLNELYTDRRIEVRNGLNGKLIFTNEIK